MTDEFVDKVVIVTGAGRGLGRAHALEFAKRGARVVVNDLGGGVDGTGSSNTAQSVVDEITELGGIAVANINSVAIPEGAASIVETAVDEFGTVDIVVNNAGILRDKTFANVTVANFKAVLDVHLLGAVYVTSAAWPILSSKGWGRVVFTSSGSGIFGNFGQSNYGAAKMGLVGLMNVLKLEGVKKGIRTNCLAPGATTRMTEGLPRGLDRGKPCLVSPAVLFLCSENAPNGIILQASGGRFSILKMCVSEGIDLGQDVDYESFSEVAHALMKDDKTFRPHL
ncbi:MAG TPA: SDR family NAD(P)-dependent oxidoreductase [Gammaproteobacteria bacterium]|nr:SDR family NAD(P)-dependent oxidoreductase [Gammaproteobacteria bacterium]